MKVGGHNVNNLRYPDALIAENEGLQQLLDIIEEENSKKGLELCSKKIKSNSHQSKKMSVHKSTSLSMRMKLKQRDQLKYLGILTSNDGRNNTEIASAKKSFQRMKSVLTNNHISIQTRRRVLECYIEPILMY